MIRKARLRLQAGLLFPAPCRERGKGRDISFSKRDIPPFHPPRENLHCKRVARRAAMLADCTAHSAAEPRLKLLYDLPLLLLPAVAQPLAALLPYGCGTPLAGTALPILQKYAVISVYRQSHQCGERSNAAFGKQSAAKQTSLAPHDSKARLISVTTCRRFMAKPCTPHPTTRKGYATSVRQQSCQRLCNAQRVQFFELLSCNGGVKGQSPLRSLGGPRGPFSHVRE